jgi:hypothetical protein
MNLNKKAIITFLSFVLTMAVIACSCSSLIPTPTAAPPPPDPMPGLAGTWHNPDTNDVFEIAKQGGQYVVVSCAWEGTNYSITSQSWMGSSLIWSYYDSDLSLTVTLTTTSLSGDSLTVNYSLSDGSSGTTTLLRGGVSVVPEPPPDVLTSPDSLTVTSAEAGVVTNGTGVSITIPAGAVPPNDDGSVGSMIFSIAQDDSMVASLPGGYVVVGPVVNLGPEGFIFEQPVTISIPLSTGVDPATVMGAAYYDPGKGVWVLVPGYVDETNNTVQVSSTHLSIWTAWGLSPEMPEDNINFGSFRLVRPPKDIGYAGPEYTYSGATSGHGICIRNAVFTDLNISDRWDAPDNFTFLVDNYWGGYTPDDREPFGKYRVPTGSYQITEFISQSEINPGDPMYIPHFYQVWRDLGTVTVEGGQIVEFPFPSWSYNDPEWTLGRPPCWGTVTTSVQTGGEGGVQVTLNWNSNADIDLHVIEPGGEEIYYSNPISTAGGALDRDNQCSDFVLGRPENIYWTIPTNGTYQVNVVYYGDCGGAGAVNFTLRVCINGNCDNPISGTVNTEDESVSVTSFTYP